MRARERDSVIDLEVLLEGQPLGASGRHSVDHLGRGRLGHRPRRCLARHLRCGSGFGGQAHDQIARGQINRLTSGVTSPLEGAEVPDGQIGIGAISRIHGRLGHSPRRCLARHLVLIYSGVYGLGLGCRVHS